MTIEMIGHQVDVQETFFPGGTLAVAATPKNISNMGYLAKAFQSSSKAKTIASLDWHFEDFERAHISKDPDYRSSFPPHGLAFQSGPSGSGRIAGAQVFAKSKQTEIPHHEVHNGEFVLEPFDVQSIRKSILDPEIEVLIKKNGDDPNNVWSNPRTEQIYAILNPQKRIPTYVYGVATDICVYAAVKGFLTHRYENIFLVQDAIAGVHEEVVQRQKEELLASGVKFVSTQTVLDLLGFKPRGD